MRDAARSSAASARGSQAPQAAAISASVTRSWSGETSSPSKRFVYSMSAASPSLRPRSTISATMASTSASTVRLASKSDAKSAANPALLLSSSRGTGGLAEALDPGADLAVARLESGAVYDKARGHLGDALDLDEPVRLQRPSAGHEVDDALAQAQLGCQLQRAVELDTFGLDTARGEGAAGG